MLVVEEAIGVAASPARVELMDKAVIPMIWSEMVPILEERGKVFLMVYSEEEVFKLCCSGFLDVWLGLRNGRLDGFAVCGWEVHARAKYYHVLGIFGSNLSLYLEQGLDRIERYALIMGADELIVDGRKGWQRMLEKRKYAARTVKLRKDLRRTLGN